mmetsp:Transcript_7815/g.14871  ORF Transcript_7815/g.14871 Transcript_7815/m.14871 type:complete len:274 (-) Transcript_7815:431-1252(-)
MTLSSTNIPPIGCTYRPRRNYKSPWRKGWPLRLPPSHNTMSYRPYSCMPRDWTKHNFGNVYYGPAPVITAIIVLIVVVIQRTKKKTMCRTIPCITIPIICGYGGIPPWRHALPLDLPRLSLRFCWWPGPGRSAMSCWISPPLNLSHNSTRWSSPWPRLDFLDGRFNVRRNLPFMIIAPSCILPYSRQPRHMPNNNNNKHDDKPVGHVDFFSSNVWDVVVMIEIKMTKRWSRMPVPSHGTARNPRLSWGYGNGPTPYCTFFCGPLPFGSPLHFC